MRTITLSLAAVSATVALFALVGGASANRLSVSGQTISATWTEAALTGGFGTVSCPMTMEGSMHTRTTTKTAGALIGYITRASVGRCRIGSASVLATTLPWHVRYEAFTGTLPNISGIRTDIIGAQWTIIEPVFAFPCLLTSTESAPNTATFTVSSGRVGGVTLGGTIESNCGIRGTASGSGFASALTITLI